jgi:hypothetical protein
MRAAVVSATVILAVSAPAAFGGGDGLLRPGDSVRTSLAHGERRTIAFAGVAGSSLDLRVAAARGNRAAPTVTLLDPAGTTAASEHSGSDGVVRIEGLPLGATGVWRIVLESTASGTFTLSTRAAQPLKFDWTGAGAAAAERTLDAAPGGDVTIVLTADGDATLDLLAPSGERLAHSVAKGGRAVMSHAALPDLGRYAIRVEGATGEYSARAVVRPAEPRRRKFRDVEAMPDVRAFTPGTAPNQSLFALDLDGSGFSSRQTVAIVKDGEVVADAGVRTSAAPGASALLDLGDVPPGTYTIEIRRRGHPTASVPGALAVTNLPPRIVAVDATTAPNTGAFPLEITGAGFDEDADVIVRPAAGGEPLPVTIVKRRRHDTIVVSVAPTPQFTGLCDVIVRDQDGGSAVLPGAIDVLGYRAAPASFVTVTGTPVQTLGLFDAALDASRGRVLAALRRGTGTASFVLLDAASLAPVDTLDIAAADFGGGPFDELQVTYDGVGDTFALCLTTVVAPARALVRIVSASDIHQTVAQQNLAAGTAETVSRVHAAPDRDDGGYLVVWDEFDEKYGSRIWARNVSSAGVFASGAPTLVAWDGQGEIGHPTAAYQGDGAFVVAWAGLSEDRFAYAVRLVMTDAAGVALSGAAPRVAATSRDWNSVARPSLAVNPADGSTLLTYWYGDGPIFRPGARGIAPGTGAPLVTALLDDGLQFDGGVPGGAVWNAARSEFVVTTVGYDNRVSVRRVAADGTLLAAARAEVYEGTAAVPYGGPVPETLGLLRVSDGVDDGLYDKKTTTLRALAGPLR